MLLEGELCLVVFALLRFFLPSLFFLVVDVSVLLVPLFLVVSFLLFFLC